MFSRFTLSDSIDLCAVSDCKHTLAWLKSVELYFVMQSLNVVCICMYLGWNVWQDKKCVRLFGYRYRLNTTLLYTALGNLLTVKQASKQPYAAQSQSQSSPVNLKSTLCKVSNLSPTFGP